MMIIRFAYCGSQYREEQYNKGSILLTIVYSILITMRKLSPVISKPLLIKQIIWEKEITKKGIESITCQVSQPLISVTLFFFVLNTAISRNVVGKNNVRATIPKGNMGYDQYAVEVTFAAFLQHSQKQVHGPSCHSFKFL